MQRTGLPIRWLMPAVLLGALVLGGWVWWTRGRPSSDALARGQAAYDRGDWEEAAGEARERLKVAASDRETMRLLAQASARLGRDAAAMSLYNRLGPSGLQAEDLCVLGQSLLRAGKRVPAVEVWERARSLEPTHAETLFELTRAYLNSDRLEDAARTAASLASRPGWESRAEALLGTIQLERNDPAGAALYWRQALERPRPAVRPEGVPSPIVPRTELARVLLRDGRPAEAREQLGLVLADGPDPEAYWLLSRVDLQEKNWSAARADTQRSGSFREDHPMQPEPAAYVGAASCAGCHPRESQAQQVSRHARTFFRASELSSLALPGASVPDPFDAKVVHALRRDPDGSIRQETKADGRIFDAVVQYAFGSGDRGLTLVGRDASSHAFELRLSEYTADHGEGSGAQPTDHRWDLTSGHPRNPSRAEEYLGQPLTEDGVRRCMFCHLTDPDAVVHRSGACALDRGIGCERCHGPAGHHLLAVEGKLVEADPAIARPAMASGGRIVKLCAECHSPRGFEVRRDDPVATRFQGTTLTWSRCYTESNDALDCITCHDPHRNASTSVAHYEARCLDCHASAGHKSTPAPAGAEGADRPRSRPRMLRDGSTRTACPVSPSTGCIGCHMPAVGGLVPHSTFTDHYIRVHRD